MPKAKRTLEREAEKEKARQERIANRVRTPKQIRARARRASKMLEEDLNELYKPLEEWDHEELARGRPRAKDGTFKGPTPKYISRELHEETIRRFNKVVKEEMNVHTIEALSVLQSILIDEETDDNGKPRVAAGTKLDAAKFLLEHIVGKPTQRVETDISVKLQGILGAAMVIPGQVDQPALRPVIDAEIVEDSDDDLTRVKDDG